MERPIIYHPASGVDHALDGADSVKVDGNNFTWREQVFDRTVTTRTNLQSAVIPDSLDGAANVTFRMVFRQVTAGAGQVVFSLSERQHDPATDSRDQVAGWSIITGGPLPPAGVPGTVDREFTIQATVVASSYTSNLELLSIISRLPADVGDTFVGEVALVRYDIDFPQLDPVTGFWAAGSLPGTIQYGGGNVGVGVNPPLQSLHLSGAVVVGNTAVNTVGSIRYNTGTNVFEGRDNVAWIPLGGGVDTDWTVSGGDLTSLAGSLVDIGLGSQSERLSVGGGIRLQNVLPNAANDGTVSYSNVGGSLDFWARKAGTWVSMTSAGGGGGNTLGQAYSEPIAGAGRVITVAAALPVLINGAGTQALRIDTNMLAEFGDPAVGIIYYAPGSFNISTQVGAASTVTLSSGSVGVGVSGPVHVESGASGGTATGDVRVRSGDNGTASGTVYLSTGGSPPVSSRGSIEVSARELRVSSNYGIRINERTNVPGAPTNAGYLYCADDGGDSELYWFDDSGNDVKLTEDGWATDGIGTFSTTFGVNRGAVGGSSSVSEVSLFGSVGSGTVQELELKNTPSGAGPVFEVNGKIAGVQSAPIIQLGNSVPTSASYISNMWWRAGTGAANVLGVIQYAYESTYLVDSGFFFSKHVVLGDDLRSYYGDEANSWLYYSSADSLLMQTKDVSLLGDSAAIGVKTGDVDTALSTSGVVAILTGNGTDNNADSGDITIATGTTVGSGTRGDLNLNANGINAVGQSFSWTTSGVPGTGAISAGVSLTLATVGAFTAGGIGSTSLVSGLSSARQPVYVGGTGANASVHPNQLAVNWGGSGARDAGEIVLRSTGGTWYSIWVDNAGKLRIESLGFGVTPSVGYHSADLGGAVVGSQV